MPRSLQISPLHLPLSINLWLIHNQPVSYMYSAALRMINVFEIQDCLPIFSFCLVHIHASKPIHYVQPSWRLANLTLHSIVLGHGRFHYLESYCTCMLIHVCRPLFYAAPAPEQTRQHNFWRLHFTDPCPVTWRFNVHQYCLIPSIIHVCHQVSMK